jgi:hypothetical protein
LIGTLLGLLFFRFGVDNRFGRCRLWLWIFVPKRTRDQQQKDSSEPSWVAAVAGGKDNRLRSLVTAIPHSRASIHAFLSRVFRNYAFEGSGEKKAIALQLRRICIQKRADWIASIAVEIRARCA